MVILSDLMSNTDTYLSFFSKLTNFAPISALALFFLGMMRIAPVIAMAPFFGSKCCAHLRASFLHFIKKSKVTL